LDGGIDRAENFKKVLDVMFEGSPPQVGSSASNSGSSGSNQEGSTPQTPSTSDKWYPDYNGDYAKGKCINELPLPTGRPNYSSGEGCCQASYGNQASGFCLSSLNTDQTTGTSPTSSTNVDTPSASLTTRPPVDPTSEAGIIISSETFINMESTMERVKDDIDNKLFLYQTPAFQWIPSSVYKYDDFIESIYIMATEGVANKKFYIGEDNVENGHVYGLVNIAAFLAQESLR